MLVAVLDLDLVTHIEIRTLYVSGVPTEVSLNCHFFLSRR